MKANRNLFWQVAVGSCATLACEPSQGRKAAALSGYRGCAADRLAVTCENRSGSLSRSAQWPPNQAPASGDRTLSRTRRLLLKAVEVLCAPVFTATLKVADTDMGERRADHGAVMTGIRLAPALEEDLSDRVDWIALRPCHVLAFDPVVHTQIAQHGLSLTARPMRHFSSIRHLDRPIAGHAHRHAEIDGERTYRNRVT